MTRIDESISQHRAAECACEESDYKDAGRYYSLAAHGAMATCQYAEPESIIPHEFGKAMYFLENAVLTFSLGGCDERARNRIDLAMVLLDDAADTLLVSDALQGFACETRGIFTLLSESPEGAAEHFEAAKVAYAAESQSAYPWLSEEIFEWEQYFFLSLRENSTIELSDSELKLLLTDFEGRIHVIRQYVSPALAEILSTGEYVPWSTTPKDLDGD